MPAVAGARRSAARSRVGTAASSSAVRSTAHRTTSTTPALTRLISLRAGSGSDERPYPLCRARVRVAAAQAEGPEAPQAWVPRGRAERDLRRDRRARWQAADHRGLL